MEAVPSVRAGSGGIASTRLDSPSREVAAQVDSNEALSSGPVDSVTLSGQAVRRLDISQASEGARGEARGDSQETRSRTGGGAGEVSDVDRARIFELRAQDRTIRTDGANQPVEPAFRGLPSFVFENGPDGRSYAVEQGEQLSSPLLGGIGVAEASAPEAEVAQAGPREAPGLEGPGFDTPPPRAELEDAAEADAQVLADAGLAPEPDVSTTFGAPQSAEPATGGQANVATTGSDVAEEATFEGGTQAPSGPAPFERTARAYQNAAALASAPGGTGEAGLIEAVA